MQFYTDYLESKGQKKYRIEQVHHAVYRDLVDSFEEISTLPKELREEMQKDLDFSPLKLVNERKSEDGTVKVIFQTKEGKKIESVLMRHLNDRSTICVSCQIGCAANCDFCATGKMGLTRNLTSDEIISQVLFFAKKLKREEDKKPTNIVFMGMGEPFHNYDNVMQAIRTLNEDKKLGFGSRHITISTCGVVSQIKKFTEEGLQVNLAISLHAPNNLLRSQIMPVNDTYPVEELIAALKVHSDKTGRRIFYEYLMLKDLNDTYECARELRELLQGSLAHVNLIPFNPGSTDKFQCSSRNQMYKFQKVLLDYGVPSTIRVSLGQDIDGACGQLAAKE